VLRYLVFAIAVSLAASCGAARAQDSFADAFWQFRASSGFNFSSGYYGAAKSTEILYLPVIVQAAKGPWTLKAVVPWIRVSGPALILDGGAEGTTGVHTSGAASGVGDINISGTYAVERLYSYGLFVDLTGRVKAPVASFSKGLGTGQWDGAIQIDVAKTLGDFMPFVGLGYRFTGQPRGFALRSVVFGTVGLQYTWTARVTSGVYYDIREAAVKAAKNPQDGTAYVNVRFNDDWSLNTYAVKGFSANSPSAGGGLVVTYHWH
jgi:hypothetical protein